MALRRRAQERIAKLRSSVGARLVDDSEEDDDDEEDEEDEDIKDKRDPISHVFRPLPQMTPTKNRQNAVLDDDWMEDPPRPVDDKRIQVNYPPSYHSYPIDSMIHTHRRKAYILMGLTCFMVVSAVMFVLCFARNYRKRRLAAYNRVQVVNLSPEEREIVRQSATRLSQAEKPVKKFHFGFGGYNKLVNAESNPSLAITENPLEAYLNAEDVRPVNKEVQSVPIQKT